MFEDGKVTVAYMKSFEIEQMWINKGIEQGMVLCQDLVQVKMRNFPPF